MVCKMPRLNISSVDSEKKHFFAIKEIETFGWPEENIQEGKICETWGIICHSCWAKEEKTILLQSFYWKILNYFKIYFFFI